MGRIIYRCVAAAFIQAVRRELRSSTLSFRCYFKGGMARNDIVPGYSDIDLLMVYATGPSKELRRAVLKARNLGLFRLIPIIGEIELVPDSLYEACQRHCQRTSLFHSPIQKERGGPEHKRHPQHLALVLEAVFDYSFHFTCRFDDSRQELLPLHRAAAKVYRHFDLPCPDFPQNFQETLDQLLGFLEEVVDPFVGPKLRQKTPESFIVSEGLGPLMVAQPLSTYYVCPPKKDQGQRGSLGHPPIFAGPLLRAFIFHFFQRHQLESLAKDDLQTWRELEFMRTGIQCQGYSINAYYTPLNELQFRFFWYSVRHWTLLCAGKEKTLEFESRFSLTPRASDLEMQAEDILDYLDELNSSTDFSRHFVRA